MGARCPTERRWPALLVGALTAVALLANVGRLGGQLAGGALLPVPGLSAVWSEYLASWHAVGGGSTSPAPPTLAVLGILGAIFYPVGGPSTAVAVLLFGDAPLAGLFCYLAIGRVPVTRPVRALVAAGYGLLPTAMVAVGQGRLDVVIAHLLLPGVLAGVAAVAHSAVRLSTACGAALGLAVIGAFQPFVLLTVVLFALAWFVARPGGGPRRVIALFVIVLLPLLLLVPWPAALVQHPALLARGVGVTVGPGPTGLVAGVLPQAVALIAIVIAVLVAVLMRRPVIRPLLPALGLSLFGTAGVILLLRLGYWWGPALIVLAAGLLWMLLTACRTDLGTRRPMSWVLTVRPPTGRALAGLAVLVLVLFVAGDLIAGRSGPLRPDRDGLTLAAPVATELTDTGRSVLVLAADGQPTRQSTGGLPAFGHDDLLASPGTPARLAARDEGLRSTDPAVARATVARAAMAGVLYLVLPDQATADRLRAAAGTEVGTAPPTSGGRPVLRINLTAGTATLISPALAETCRTFEAVLSFGSGGSTGPATLSVQNDVFFSAPAQPNEKCMWLTWHSVGPEQEYGSQRWS